MQAYLDKVLHTVKPIWAAIISALCYVFFPERAFQTAVQAVAIAMIMDVVTKRWAIAKERGKVKWTSQAFWAGSEVKLKAYLVIMFMTGLSYRVIPLAQASVFLATFVYSFMFLREFQSILENLEEMGADVGWLLLFVKKKQDELSETPMSNIPNDLEGR